MDNATRPPEGRGREDSRLAQATTIYLCQAAVGGIRPPSKDQSAQTKTGLVFKSRGSFP